MEFCPFIEIKGVMGGLLIFQRVRMLDVANYFNESFCLQRNKQDIIS